MLKLATDTLEYDTESSRYYDPEMGRFINADAFASTGQGLLGNNMFAYCLNNPVIFSDSSGELPIAAILWTLASGFTAGSVSAFVAWGTGGTSEEILNEFYWGFSLGIIGSAGSVGTAISLGIGALRAYCDNRESGVDIEHSFYTSVVSTVFSLPFPSTGSQGEDFFWRLHLEDIFRWFLPQHQWRYKSTVFPAILKRLETRQYFTKMCVRLHRLVAA